jgi:two-component system NarL family sensor kinase
VVVPARPDSLRRRLVVVAAATQLALVVWLGIFLFVVVPRTSPPFSASGLEQRPTLMALLVAVSTLAVAGYVLARRRPGHWLAPVMLAMPLVLALQYGMHSWELLAGRFDWPGVQLTQWATGWWFLLLPPCLVVLLLRLPTGQPLSGRWLRYERGVLAHTGLVILLFAFAPRLPGTDPDYPANPWGIAALGPIAPLSLVLYALLAVHLVVALASLGVRFRRGDPTERQQLRWIASGAGALITSVLIPTLFGAPTGLMALGIVAFVGTVTVAALRFRLWELGLVLRRTLVYLLLTGFLVAGYVGLVLGLRSLLTAPLVPELLVTAVVAVVALPLREVLQRALDRMLFGERRDPHVVVRALGRRLEDGAAPVLPAVVGELTAALRLPAAAIVLPDGTVVAAHGTPTGDGARVPLQHHGRVVGELLADRRHPAEALTGLDLRLLADVAGHLGVVVQSAVLEEAVRRSQERLASAREAERDRLRRDLHDEMGPVLGAASLRVKAAQNLLGASPPALPEAGTVLQAVVGDLDRAMREVQRLITDLHPEALAGGLLDALQEHARGWAGNLRLTLSLPELLPPLDATVEAAAYRIAVEGLHNAERHSGGTTVTLAVTECDCQLEVIVADDGRGLRQPPSRGVGLGSMLERARAVGGILRLEPSGAGGLRVHATLPCSPAALPPAASPRARASAPAADPLLTEVVAS